MKQMLWAAVILFAACVLHFEARAEGNCPAGYYPVGGGNSGYTGCAPMNSGSSGSSSGAQENGGGYWETRWGAIAHGDFGDGKSIYGSSDGASSRRSATKSAVEDCKKWGGRNCKLSMAYYNQCGVIVNGERAASTARGPNIDVATELAMQQCRKSNQVCTPYHAGCSYAQRVR